MTTYRHTNTSHARKLLARIATLLQEVTNALANNDIHTAHKLIERVLMSLSYVLTHYCDKDGRLL